MASYKDTFKITHNDVLPIQGSLLISEPFLQDAYFQRSVILLMEHTTEGSMGFILNKKTDLLVNSFFKDFQELPQMPIYLREASFALMCCHPYRDTYSFTGSFPLDFTYKTEKKSKRLGLFFKIINYR